MANELMVQFNEIITSGDQQSRLRELLPDDVPLKRFTAVVIRAVQEDPDLLRADKKTLFLACQRAAQDGLIPDKREGALVVYNTKSGDQWIKTVQWQPMIAGIRKNLARHGFDLQAFCVHENDEFDYELGSDPWVKHKPAKLGTGRGLVIGAYAVATGPDGRKYIDVMELPELEQVRGVAKSDAVWKKWTGEMYRKTVARRLLKSLPIADEPIIKSMVDSDNAGFDLNQVSQPSKAATDVQKALRGEPAKITSEPAMGADDPIDMDDGEYVESDIVEPDEPEAQRQETMDDPGF